MMLYHNNPNIKYTRLASVTLYSANPNHKPYSSAILDHYFFSVKFVSESKLIALVAEKS